MPAGRISFLLFTFYFLILSSCDITKQLSRSAKENVLSDSSLLTAHVGISIYEPATSKYWYNYNGEKYFVPASNTKIPTCYAAMKYLGDSLVGLRYRFNRTQISDYDIISTGDPTFLHPDFKRQNVLKFFQTHSSNRFFFDQNNWYESHLGSGWAWNDYDEYYMAERSPFPIFGNVAWFKKNGDFSFKRINQDSIIIEGIDIFPRIFKNLTNVYGESLLKKNRFGITRSKEENRFKIFPSEVIFNSIEIPFTNDGIYTALNLLKDTVQINFSFSGVIDKTYLSDMSKFITKNEYNIIYSQPTDSLLKPMMHRSDNFFAEQSLLMVSNEKLGIMNDAKIIDTLLKTDFKDLPQKPRWVDGSGLSRYNLFTPQDFVTILGKMKNEFGMDRIKEIFPTGGEGTISSYYKSDSGYIYAKTGTLSGVVALSGFLTTKKGKQLIFSVLINNHNNSATVVRKAVERFMQGIREKY